MGPNPPPDDGFKFIVYQLFIQTIHLSPSSPNVVQWRATITTYRLSDSSGRDKYEFAEKVELGVLSDGKEVRETATASISLFKSNPAFIDVTADSRTKVECLVNNTVGTAKNSVVLSPDPPSFGAAGTAGVIVLIIFIIFLIVVISQRHRIKRLFWRRGPPPVQEWPDPYPEHKRGGEAGFQGLSNIGYLRTNGSPEKPYSPQVYTDAPGGPLWPGVVDSRELTEISVFKTSNINDNAFENRTYAETNLDEEEVIGAGKAVEEGDQYYLTPTDNKVELLRSLYSHCFTHL